jgi:hypothetical protein
MQGHEARLAEFRAADGEHAGIEIEIVYTEIASFAETQAGDAEQSEQPVVGPRAESSPRRQGASGVEQPSDLGIRVEIGRARFGRYGNKPSGGISVRGSMAW